MTEAPSSDDLSQPFGSFCDILHRWAEFQPDRPALGDDGGTLSWADLADRIDRIAARLLETGLERGQAVTILGTSSIPYALAFLGAVRAGGVPAPLTTSASAQQLEAMAQDSGARHIFIDRAKLAELGDQCFAGLARIVLDEELEAWMAAEGTRPDVVPPEPGEPFNIIYSSGTTGTPKGIVHSHRMRWRQFASTAASWLDKGLEVRAFASTPLYSNTTMVAFLAPLLAGGYTRIIGKFDARSWLEYAEADRTTITMLVPVQYQRLLDLPGFDDFDLSALQLKYCTSAPFPAELKREVLDRMPGGLIEIYSMTEGGVVCLLQADKVPGQAAYGRATGSGQRAQGAGRRGSRSAARGKRASGRAQPDDDVGLSQPAGRNAQDGVDRSRHRRGLAKAGGHRADRSRWVRRTGRPGEGHDHFGRVQYLPDRSVNIYELGLIYDIAVNHLGEVYVRMTLTSPACPVAGTLRLKSKLKSRRLPKSPTAKSKWCGRRLTRWR